MFQAVFFFFFMSTALPEIVCVQGGGQMVATFCLLGLGFADGKRHEYSHDANVFLQVNYIPWLDTFHQCPSSPLSWEL